MAKKATRKGELTKQEVKQVLTDLIRLKQKEKKLKQEMGSAKGKILLHAKAVEQTEFLGPEGGKVTIKSQTDRKISPAKVFDRLKELFRGKERKDAFGAVFSVLLTKADYYLGEAWVTQNCDSVKTNQYNSVQVEPPE